MSKQANPTVVGGFIVGAVVLAVAGIIVFGGGKYFEKRLTYFLVFDGSVGGLNIGAPVRFRGVQVGEVTDVRALYDPEKTEIQIQVLIEVDPHSVQEVGEGGERTQRTFQEVKENIPRMVKRGLRAQLQTQSFVTGQKYIAFDLHPDKPAEYTGFKSKYPELPTISSSMSELTAKLEKIPIEKLVQDLRDAIQGINDVVSSPEVMDAIRSFNSALKSVDNLARNVDAEVKPAAKSIENAMSQAETTLEEVEKTIEPGSELSAAVEELAAAARSIRILAEYLERHPEALIRGK
jgi:paraquat-inducible protein B